MILPERAFLFQTFKAKKPHSHTAFVNSSMNYLIKGGLISSFKLQKPLTDHHPAAAASQGFTLPRPAGGWGWTGWPVTKKMMRRISDEDKDESTRLIRKQVVFPHLPSAWRECGGSTGLRRGFGILILSVWTNQSGSWDGALCAIFSTLLPKQSASLLCRPALTQPVCDLIMRPTQHTSQQPDIRLMPGILVAAVLT